ncbi:MAG: Do family serine endopeptidase [Gemmatimonadaceae bacterium]|jgi:serine protease Do|nr:Do family serine endopeptidase [Gemmatimonadaceae bacterium]
MSRLRFVVALVLAFTCGLVFASGMDLTSFSWAQGGAQPTIATPVSGRGVPAGGTDFSVIAERVTPAVVAIRTERTMRGRDRNQMRRQMPPGMEEFFDQFQGPQQPQPMSGEGSGFIVTPDGYILTNTHVVAGADRVTVTLSDQRTFKARVVGQDSTTDVAVIKIDGSAFPTLSFGNDDGARIGEWVLAVGNPLGLDFTVTAGIISAKGRGGREVQLPNAGSYTVSDFIQTDAAINPGNSGGPLLNTRGEVIGINSAIASRTGFYSGYGFAIPISLAKNVMDDLVKFGRVRAPVLGISIQDVEQDDASIAGLKSIAGVKVQEFNPPDGPAKRAGMEYGDVIVAIDGKPVDRVSTLQRTIRMHKPGETVTVDVMRYGQKKSFKVTLMERPDGPRVAQASPADDAPAKGTSSGKLGISVEPVSAEFADRAGLTGTSRSGARVVEVNSDGPSRNKLIPGFDIIVEVIYPAPRRKVTSPEELGAALAGLKTGEFVSLRVLGVGSQGPPLARVVNIKVGEASVQP